jgi:hypothetical protein
MNPTKRGNTYSTHYLEALVVCKAIEYWRYYREGYSTKLLVTYHDTLRHLLREPNNKLNKRQAHYMRDLQPFVGSMTIAYRKGAIHEANTLSRRLNFVLMPKFHCFGIVRFRHMHIYDGSPSRC